MKFPFIKVKLRDNEGPLNFFIRTIGFGAVLVIDIIMNANFFSSLGRSFALPILGITFVFLKTWHFIRMIETKNNTKKRFYFTGWLTMAVISIFATVSFGLALAKVGTTNTEAITSTENTRQEVASARIEQLVQERRDIPERIRQNEMLIQAKEVEKTTIGSTTWSQREAQNRLNAEIATLREVNTASTERLNFIDTELKSLEQSLSEQIVVSTQSEGSNQIDAILVFSQLFPKEMARSALLVFFFIIGLAMEVTMAMALLPPDDKKPQEEPIGLPPEPTKEPEPNPPVPEGPKPKRKYTKRNKTENASNLNRSAEVGETPASANSLEITPKFTTKEEIKKVVESAIAEEAYIVPPSSPDGFSSTEAIRDSPASTDDEVTEDNVRIIKKHAKVHDLIISLFNNGEHRYLKDLKDAIEDSGIAKADALRVFDYLSSHKHEGTPLIEFRKHTGKWHPNFTSEWILNHLKNTQIGYEA